jgi:hypothetical protein
MWGSDGRFTGAGWDGEVCGSGIRAWGASGSVALAGSAGRQSNTAAIDNQQRIKTPRRNENLDRG